MTALLPLFALFTRAVRADVRSRFQILLRSILLLVLFLLTLVLQVSFFVTAPGQVLLGFLATLNFLGITLLGLATFGSAITEEKDEGMLSLLRITRLNPLAIVLGKSTARLASGLLFVAVQIPFALLCATLGGVSPAQIFEVYSVLGAYLFFLCNLGLFASVICRTTGQAVTTTLALGLLLFLVLPMIWFSSFALGGSFHPLSAITGFATSVNPVLQLADAVAGRKVMLFQPDSIAFLLIAGAACFLAAWLGFERFCRDDDATPVAAARSKSGPAACRARSRAWPRALAWKDFTFSSGGWRGMAWRLFIYAGLFAVWFWLSTVNAWGSHAVRVANSLAFAGSTGFLIEFAIAAASIFGRERRQHTLGTIWILPLSAAQLFRQKALGYTLGLIPGAAIWLGSFVASEFAIREMEYAFSSAGTFEYFALRCGTYANSLLELAFFGALVIYLSLRMRRGALVAGLAVFAIYYIIFYILSWILVGLGSVPGFMTAQIVVVWVLNIFLAILTVFIVRLIPARLAALAAED